MKIEFIKSRLGPTQDFYGTYVDGLYVTDSGTTHPEIARQHYDAIVKGGGKFPREVLYTHEILDVTEIESPKK